MFWRILKKVLSILTLTVHYRDGDLIQIKLVWGGNVVFDRTVDIMKGV